MEKKWREKEIPSLFVSINFPFCSASHVSRTRLSTRSTKKLVSRKNLSQDFCELIFRFDIETALKNNARISIGSIARIEKFGIIFAAEKSEWQSSRLRRIKRSFPFILSIPHHGSPLLPTFPRGAQRANRCAQ